MRPSSLGVRAAAAADWTAADWTAADWVVGGDIDVTGAEFGVEAPAFEASCIERASPAEQAERAAAAKKVTTVGRDIITR